MPEPRKLARRYHLHPPGVLYVAISVVLGIGAINSQNNLLFVVFGVALSALLFSGFLSGAMLMGVTVERRPLTPVPAGQPLRVTYAVHNRNRFIPAFALSISERRPRRRAANRWTSLISTPTAFAAQVGPRSTLRVSAAVRTRRRGAAALDVIVVSSSFPFGVFRKSIRVSQPEQLVVLPATRRLSPAIFQSIHARARRGDTTGSNRGRGDEFYGLRDYSRGDSPRYIAWKASARSGTLVTRLTTDQTSSVLRVLLLLEDPATGDHDATEHTNESTITLAASLIEEANARQIHVGLCAPQCAIRLEPGATSRHRINLLRALALIDLDALEPEPAGITPFGAAGANLVIAPHARRHALAPPDVPMLASDALSRWALDPDPAPPRPGAERSADRAAKRGAA